MCGIVGYIGPRQAAELIVEGLRRLEYRGYDSVGVALRTAAGRIATVRSVSRVADLRADLVSRAAAAPPEDASTGLGIGHTRWATCGTVQDARMASDDAKRTERMVMPEVCQGVR